MEQERQEQTTPPQVPTAPAAAGRTAPGPSAVAGPRIPVECDTRIEDLLRAAARTHPDRTAVTSAHGPLTYSEMDRRADRLARTLRAAGAAPGTRVAVAVERSHEMLVAVFAVLRAGAAYVPVDPGHPPARNAYVLRDSGAGIVVAAPGTLERPDGTVTLVDPYAPESYDADDSPVEHTGDGTDVAYVIYTSGSTGEPKGVMVEHRSVLNRLRWMQRAYPIGAQDVLLQKTPIGFDVSVWELFWWTLAGASVHLLEPGGERDPDTIAAAVEEHGVTVAHFVPSMLHAFMEHTDNRTDRGHDLSSLRRVFASGEALSPHHVRRFHEVLGGAPARPELVNLYGPTEATVDVTHHPCADPAPRTVPIGRPIDNVRLYVLDDTLRPCSAGEAGELCIAGVSLARGYLGRDRLTAERFVEDPFPGERRVYRTGDLARLLPDGSLEYLGRNDHQVKIRGVRVEPGEVENTLLAHPAVVNAAVIARHTPTGEAYLCAYTVCRRELPAGELRSHCARLLPAALVPAHVVPLASLPLTPNGKLDRAALPAPPAPASGPPDPDTRGDTGRPAARAEHLIASAWAKVLGIPAETIGRADNFYDLGGTSLAVLAVAAELRGHLGLKDLMRQTQLGPLADTLARHASQEERRP
ncbi:non-ribosomal peptide synthetase [Streptomyces sp. NPDC005774]|uniref:non-ribosomal peptide synthetase n=1 Tax=Streptomyces sp. NPDC005774 TaxID=3364728 RepID=UPI003677D87C